MIVKFDAQTVVKVALARKMSKETLRDICGFMFADILERLEPFGQEVEIDVTERLIEGVTVKADSMKGKA